MPHRSDNPGTCFFRNLKRIGLRTETEDQVMMQMVRLVPLAGDAVNIHPDQRAAGVDVSLEVAT